MSAVEAIKQWFHEQWRASLDEVVRGRAKIWKAARWKLRDRYETGKCKGAEAPTGKKRRACYPHSLPRCFYSGSFVMLWDVFLGAHKHAYNFVSSFFSTPLSSSPLSTKLPPVFQGWPVYFIQNCLTLTGLRPGREYEMQSQMLGLKAEPDSRGSPAKLGLCVTSMIPEVGVERVVGRPEVRLHFTESNSVWDCPLSRVT